jgi:pilus assembly protein CpaF
MKTKTTTINSLKNVLGPLWKLYSDSSVYNICIDSYDDVYYFQGKESKTASKLFKSSKDVELLVNRLIRFTGKKLDETSKSIFLNIDEYTKVTIALPPVAIKGPSIIINKLPLKEVSLDDLVKYKALDEEGKSIIINCIENGKGILVAGNPGSGKTTLLNTFVNAIPQPQRVVTIERYADLVIQRQRVCQLQTSNQKAEELVELVAIAERMFPDYLVISNFEGPEVMPFLEVARSNCSALGLITGENPLDGLKRLETKAVLSSEGMSLEDARYAITQSFGHIVFQEKRDGGKRLVSSIGEIRYEAGEIKLKMIYKR